MDNDWPGDDAEFDLALNDGALEQLLDATSAPKQQPSRNSECDGFDGTAGNNWLYPSNLPLRSYQHSIVQAALYRNTLVVLPTGLGKTFIAAVVMYNLYRWYPSGKLIFMAPTRPLVSQQIVACQKIMPFPVEDTVELTGRLPRAKRAELWMSKRVFFVTPQVVQSDMLESADGMQFPFNSIKLLVVDEAHRAKGRYAYTQVTESIMARNHNFRILALSATPGRTVDDVAAVCRNLYISHLEVRWDNSIDVQPYIHQRSIRTIVVSIKDNIKEPRARLLQIIDPYLRQLIAADVLKSARGNISRNALLYDQSRFQERTASGQRHPEHTIVVSNFSMCISLYHALELLERHGLRVFVNNFDADDRGRDKFVLRDVALRDLVEHVRQQLGANPLDISTRPMTNGQVPAMPAKLDFGHPKYEHARIVMQEHFESNPESRAIVFCEYRESVMLIQRLLLQHRPLVRARCFVGQSSNGAGICALTQKEQLQIMADFRSGTTNVLVATSIGEEGLDVGEVELIVCFDICSSNPTRFVQRIGRTGRQKRGHVVMLVTEGREQQLLKEMLANKNQMNRKLLQSPVIKDSLYQHAPRMVPPQFSPKCEQRFMEPIKVPTKADAASPKSKARKPPKEPTVKCHDLRKFFKQSQDKFLQDEPAYKVSEATQNLLQKEVARRSVGVKNFLLDTQTLTAPETSASPTANATISAKTSTISSSQEETQRLRKITRLLQASKPLVSESQRNQDLFAQLQDKQLPHSLKLYLLQSNAAFVLEMHAKVQQQMQQEVPVARLNSRQQRTRRIYELVLQICHGEVESLLKPEESCAELTLKDLLQPSDNSRQQQFEADCLEIFKGLRDQGICADNHEILQEQLEQLELRQLEQTMKDQLGNESTGIYEHWEQLDELEHEDPAASVQQQSCSVYDSQWRDFMQKENVAQHSSTPVRPHVEIRKQELEDSSVIDSSQLSANLSRLNCLMNVASTPKNKDPKSLAKNSVLNALDEDLSAFDNLIEQEALPSCAPKANITVVKTESTTAADMSTPEALDIDLNDFLDPLPEEKLLLQSIFKENQPPSATIELPTENAGTPRNLSPDLFAEDGSLSPWKPTATTAPAQVKSLAAKLAAKQPTKAIAKTPERQKNTAAGVVRSPSIFENYLQRMRGRGQLSRAAQRLHSMTSSTFTPSTADGTDAGQEEDSPIVRRRPAKRKIYDISDEDQENDNSKELISDDSIELVPATQISDLTTPPRKRRQKRAKFNSFIMMEADQSGSDHEEEEDAERTFGCYLKDSVIVSSDEEDEHNDTDAHVMYLQHNRSPVHRPGAFKIPAPRVYHNESIYSQPVDMEPSQYIPSSFIADDESLAHESRDVSECPLERAERILKEQRRQRKRGGTVAPATMQNEAISKGKRRRIQTLTDSSDDDDVILIN